MRIRLKSIVALLTAFTISITGVFWMAASPVFGEVGSVADSEEVSSGTGRRATLPAFWANTYMTVKMTGWLRSRSRSLL